MTDLSKEELKLDYPCNWNYKLVVNHDTNINDVMKEILSEREHKVTHSKSSSKGKFKSYSLDLLVHNDDDRKELYALLGDHEAIKMIV